MPTVITPLITAKDLRLVLNQTTYVGIFDDDNTNDLEQIDASDQVKQCIEGAHAMVISALPNLYPVTPDGTDAKISILLKHAERLYAGAMAYMRRPEVALTQGDDKKEASLWQQAESVIKRLQEGNLRIAAVDAPPAPTPSNVGGIVIDSGLRTFADGPNGESNLGDL